MMVVQCLRIPNGILWTITSHDIFGIMLWFISHAFIGPVRYVVSTIVINFSSLCWILSHIVSTPKSYCIFVPTYLNNGGSSSPMYVIIIPSISKHGSKLENRRCCLGMCIDGFLVKRYNARDLRVGGFSTKHLLQNIPYRNACIDLPQFFSVSAAIVTSYARVG